MTTPVNDMRFSVDPNPPDADEAWLNGQDITDPVWPSMPVEALAEETRHEKESVRLLSGALDLLHHVKEEIDYVDGPEHVVRGIGRQRPKVLPVIRVPADSWRANTYDVGHGVIDGPMRILQQRGDRTRAVIVNWGPGVLYLSHDSNTLQGTLPGVGTIQVPVSTATFYAPKELYTGGEVWAYPTAVGTTQIVDVQDEYGWPE